MLGNKSIHVHVDHNFGHGDLTVYSQLKKHLQANAFTTAMINIWYKYTEMKPTKQKRNII